MLYLRRDSLAGVFSLMFESTCIALLMLCDLYVEHGQLSQFSESTVTP